MRLSSVIRWLVLVPSAVVAWYFAVFVSVVLREIVVGRCFGSDAPPPEYCQASWFPREFLSDALLFFGVGLSAVVVVVVAAVVAPSHKRHVAWVARQRAPHWRRLWGTVPAPSQKQPSL